LVDRFVMSFLDLCPEAASYIERYRAAVPAPEEKAPVGRRLFAPQKLDAAYVFADPYIVNASDWDDFDATTRQQLLLATERMTGKKVKSPRSIAKAIDEDSSDEFELRLWNVYAANPSESDAPVFDCWVFNVDNAVFFKHGTLERIQVYALQGSFMDDDGAPTSAELAKSLAASAPKSLWET
jgi:hypothetical protein